MGATIGVARDVLRRTFGHADFRGLQAGVIGEVLAGRSALAVLPTGGGKSLCYQIPSLVRPGLGLVISPLIALMADQVAALQQSGVAAEKLDSSTEPSLRADIWRRIDEGVAGPALPLARRPDAAVDAGAAVAPAARAGRDRRGALRQPVGPRLPPRVPHAGPAGGGLPQVPRLAVTATADARTRDDIRAELRLGDAREFVDSFARPELALVGGAQARRTATGACWSWWPSGRAAPA